MGTKMGLKGCLLHYGSSRGVVCLFGLQTAMFSL